MPDYITLLGAEEVARASHRMQSAAEQMSRAAGNMDEVLERHRRWQDDWLQRFETAVEQMNKEKP